MNLSHHANERIIQRNIDPRLTDLLMQFGKRVSGCHDRYILKEQNIPSSIIKKASNALIAHIKKQLPIIGVISDDSDTLVTVFKPNDRIRWKRESHFCKAR